MGKYRLEKSSNDKYYWNLLAGNGEPILTSEMYNSKDGAENGIASCKTNSGDEGRYERLVSKSEQPYFTLRGGNDETIGRSEMYSSESSRDNGIASCMKYGPDTATDDRTGDSHGRRDG